MKHRPRLAGEENWRREPRSQTSEGFRKEAAQAAERFMAKGGLSGSGRQWRGGHCAGQVLGQQSRLVILGQDKKDTRR